MSPPTSTTPSPMKKACSVDFSIIYIEVHSQQKAPLLEQRVVMEKGCLYFGQSSWKLSFRDLDYDALSKQRDHLANGEVVFQNAGGSKVFECVLFGKQREDRFRTTSFALEIQAKLHTLQSFVERVLHTYQKWYDRHDFDNDDEDPQEIGIHHGLHSNTAKLASFGRVCTSNPPLSARRHASFYRAPSARGGISPTKLFGTSSFCSPSSRRVYGKHKPEFASPTYNNSTFTSALPRFANAVDSSTRAEKNQVLNSIQRIHRKSRHSKGSRTKLEKLEEKWLQRDLQDNNDVIYYEGNLDDNKKENDDFMKDCEMEKKEEDVPLQSDEETSFFVDHGHVNAEMDSDDVQNRAKNEETFKAREKSKRKMASLEKKNKVANGVMVGGRLKRLRPRDDPFPDDDSDDGKGNLFDSKTVMPAQGNIFCLDDDSEDDKEYELQDDKIVAACDEDTSNKMLVSKDNSDVSDSSIHLPAASEVEDLDNGVALSRKTHDESNLNVTVTDEEENVERAVAANVIDVGHFSTKLKKTKGTATFSMLQHDTAPYGVTDTDDASRRRKITSFFTKATPIKTSIPATITFEQKTTQPESTTTAGAGCNEKVDACRVSSPTSSPISVLVGPISHSSKTVFSTEDSDTPPALHDEEERDVDGPSTPPFLTMPLSLTPVSRPHIRAQQYQHDPKDKASNLNREGTGYAEERQHKPHQKHFLETDAYNHESEIGRGSITAAVAMMDKVDGRVESNVNSGGVFEFDEDERLAKTTLSATNNNLSSRGPTNTFVGDHVSKNTGETINWCLSKSTFSGELASSPVTSLQSVQNPYRKTMSAKARNESYTQQEYTDDVGMRNLGNTCYINSSLQMLFSIPRFVSDVDAVYKSVLKAQNKGNVVDNILPLTRAFLSVAWNVGLFSADKEKAVVKTADPSILKRAMDELTDKFVGYEQRDAHEFLSDLIDLLHDELDHAITNVAQDRSNNAIAKDATMVLPTDEYFRLNVKVCLTCDTCGYSRSMEEMYRHLSIDIGGDGNADETWTVEKGIKQFFQPKKLEVKCEKCSEGKSATQLMKILSRPKALLLHLKRFILTQAPRPEHEGINGEKSAAVQMSFRKNKAPVVASESLHIESFHAENEENSEGKASPQYKVRGVVRHIGNTAFSGHYTADAARSSKTESSSDEGRWVSFDDGLTTLTLLSDVLNEEQSRRNVYMLLYALDSDLND